MSISANTLSFAKAAVVSLLSTFLLVLTPVSPASAATDPCLTIVNNVVTSGAACTGHVVVPNGVIAIGAEAFQDSRVTSVDLPDSVLAISAAAFARTHLMHTISLPRGLTSIGNYAFIESHLAQVRIPNSLTSVGIFTFAYSSISSVVFEGNLPGGVDLGSAFIAVTAVGYIDPGATGFGPLGERWNGLTLAAFPYAATFQAQDGSSVAPQNRSVISVSPITTRENHTFLGWFDQASAGNQVTFPFSLLANTTVFAQWRINPPPAPSLPYSGPLPMEYSARSAFPGDRCSIVGRKLDLITEVSIDGLIAPITNQSKDNLEIVIPQGLSAGMKDLVLKSSEGTITAQNAIRIEVKIAVPASPIADLSASPIADLSASSKINAGSFNGYVAVYAKGYKGQRLSWKIGKKWFKVNVTSDFQVFQRRIGVKDVLVQVDIYKGGERRLTKTLRTR